MEETPRPVEADLLVELGNREITVFGMTGTVQNLADKCPVDLNDPVVSLEAKNEFVVKAMNEAGLDIEPKYQSLFQRVIQKHGLEQKFTVREPSKHQEKAEPATPLAAQKPDKAAVTGLATVRSVPKEPVVLNQSDELTPILALRDEVLESAQLGTEIARITRATETELFAKPLEQVSPTIESGEIYNVKRPAQYATEQVMYTFEPATADAEKIPAAAPETDMIAKARLAVAEIMQPQTEPTLPAPNLMVRTSNKAKVEPTQTHTAITETAVIDLPDTHLELAVNTGENMLLVEETTLAPDQPDIIDNFTEALIAMIVTEAFTIEDHVSIEKNDGLPESATPEILQTVSLKLAEMEMSQKEQVVPILQAITAALEVSHTLEDENEIVVDREAIRIELEELCVKLFEILDIVYDDHQITELVAAMLSPEFQVSLPVSDELVALDLEHAGTHEAKKQLQKLTGSISTISQQLRDSLGKFAISLYAGT